MPPIPQGDSALAQTVRKLWEVVDSMRPYGNGIRINQSSCGVVYEATTNPIGAAEAPAGGIKWKGEFDNEKSYSVDDVVFVPHDRTAARGDIQGTFICVKDAPANTGYPSNFLIAHDPDPDLDLNPLTRAPVGYWEMMSPNSWLQISIFAPGGRLLVGYVGQGDDMFDSDQEYPLFAVATNDGKKRIIIDVGEDVLEGFEGDILFRKITYQVDGQTFSTIALCSTPQQES